MIELSRCRQLIDCNLSLIPIGDKKVPWIKWKQYQTSVINKDEFSKLYSDERTKGVGICTGFNNLEVIDIDLKIFKSLKEQQDFWNELLAFLKDNIDSFDDKFVIYKTINNGYHILYRCNVITGNKKIAKLQNHTEAIIESRGVGGYVFVYDKQVSKLSYTEIQEVSILDREVLWSICMTYDFKEHTKEDIKNSEYSDTKLTPWDDYNQKTQIFDIVSDDFTIVRQLSDKYIIKRHGAESAHSGYIYKNSGLMYLFTTATLYPHEKAITPFTAYTYKYCAGDFKKAAKEIYDKGFGTRNIKKPKEVEQKIKINLKDLSFPIDIFPTTVQNYIIECNSKLDSIIDYMGASFIWLTSLIIGNSIRVQPKKGWEEPASVWIAIVGRAGIGKTPSINICINPILKHNNREIKNYIKQYEKYQSYIDLDAEAKKNSEIIRKPKKTQFVVNDITLEALVSMHEENDVSVGVHKDELAGWIKDMNKYREGADLEFWLSSWSGSPVSINRKTSKDAHINRPFIPVLGGIQPTILDLFYTEENKQNGFIDRMLLCYPETDVDKYNDKEISEELIQWYSDSIISFYDEVRSTFVKRDNEDEIEPFIARFSAEANEEWIRIFNEITVMQNSDDENEYMKSMLPKQKSYIPRFALIINTISVYFESTGSLTKISKDSILKAEKLSKYFIAMSKKIKIDSVVRHDVKAVIKDGKDKTTKQKATEILEQNPSINKTELAELLGISRQQLYKYINN